MTVVADRYIVADSLSEGWLDAVRCLDGIPSGKAVHLLVRILNPLVEVSEIRAEAQLLIDGWNDRQRVENKRFYDIETTRNTLFPAAWARRHPEPADLVDHYRARYLDEGDLRKVRANQRGTYFGRIVAYPRSNGESADQLTDTVRKLRDELRSRSGPKSSRYEINIYNEAKDRNPISFPCLAHLSVHVHEGRLHVQAIYRNETLVGRAYGNYLGIAELQSYIAQAAGVELGELLITAGHVELESGVRSAAREMLGRLAGQQDESA
jgi:thymidylate synthase